MLVDVVALRHMGKKLTPDALRAAVPVRGDLLLFEEGSRRTDDLRRWPVAQLIAEGADVLLPLREARVTKINGDSILVGGTEVHVSKEWRIASSYSCVQVWWCRRVSDCPARAACG